MKITNPEGLQSIRPEKGHPNKSADGSTSFGNILRDALGKPDVSQSVQKTDALSEPRSIQRLGEPRFQAGYTDKTSKVIELMNSYAESLANPRKTLKDIESELMTFVEEARSLHDEYVNSGNANTELENIMKDLLRTARLESARFQRGDYLDPE